MVALRDYQSRAVEAILNEWQDVSSTLISHPTGCGKTTIFTEVVRRRQPERALILAHREELIFQIQERLQEQAGLWCEIEMAEMDGASTEFNGAPAVVATVQTLISGRGDKRRMHRFSPNEFGLLIIDECHHSTAASYRAIIDHFKLNPDLRILGVTATPDRADEEALGQVFETVADDYGILDAIHDGWLVPIDQQMVHIEGLDYTEVRTTAGDLNSGDLAVVMEAEKNLQGVVGSTIEIIDSGQQAIVFTASVKHAELACDIFNRHKSGMADWVSAKTPKKERREKMGQFKDGRLQVICNVGVITEGVDVPSASVVVMARPTKSRSLYAQMAGRVLRPLPGLVDGLSDPISRKTIIAQSTKPSALIIDFVGNSGRHRLMTSADILGGKVSDEAIELAIRKSMEGRVRMDKILDEAEEEIRKQKEEEERRLMARRAKLKARVNYYTRKIDPFAAFDLAPARERGWDLGKSLSEKQRGLLLKQGIDPATLTYAQGKQLINNLFYRWAHKLASLKQCACLKKYGYVTKNMKRDEASKLIDQLARNGWRR